MLNTITPFKQTSLTAQPQFSGDNDSGESSPFERNFIKMLNAKQDEDGDKYENSVPLDDHVQEKKPDSFTPLPVEELPMISESSDRSYPIVVNKRAQRTFTESIFTSVASVIMAGGLAIGTYFPFVGFQKAQPTDFEKQAEQVVAIADELNEAIEEQGVASGQLNDQRIIYPEQRQAVFELAEQLFAEFHCYGESNYEYVCSQLLSHYGILLDTETANFTQETAAHIQAISEKGDNFATWGRFKNNTGELKDYSHFIVDEVFKHFPQLEVHLAENGVTRQHIYEFTDDQLNNVRHLDRERDQEEAFIVSVVLLGFLVIAFGFIIFKVAQPPKVPSYVLVEKAKPNKYT